jgi:hypothetical protein
VNKQSPLSSYRFLGYVTVILCLLALADGVLPQAEMMMLRGHMPISNIVTKFGLLTAVAFGCLVHPRIRRDNLPLFTWMLCIAYLIADIGYLILFCNLSLGDVLQSYNAYYLLLLVGIALLTLQNSVPEHVIMRCVISLFVLCAAIAIAQYLTGKPLVYTESSDGSFQVNSWTFFDNMRAFSLFSSGLTFGLFCALCGALGVAISKTSPLKGALLCVLSAVACFITLTRLSYLVFVCACTSSLVLTFGKKASRGLAHPFLYATVGLSTIVIGVRSAVTGGGGDLENQMSLLERVSQWIYYSSVIVNAALMKQLFGLGVVQNEKLARLAPMVIDNTPLALVLHIGIFGLAIVGILMFKMWLYLRRQAISTKHPFIIAAASVWAVLLCAGMFNVIFSSFGAIFSLAILCQTEQTKKEVHYDGQLHAHALL